MQVRLLPGPAPAARGGRASSVATPTIGRSNALQHRQAPAREHLHPAAPARKSRPPRRRTLSREKLKALEALQQVDLKIRDLTAEAEKHPARLRQIEAERNQARAQLDATRGRLADNERARRQNEQLLQLEKEKVRKRESRLNERKT